MAAPMAGITPNKVALIASLAAAIGATLIVAGAVRWPGAYSASFAEVTYREAALLRTRMDVNTLDGAAAQLDPSRAAFLDMRVAQEAGVRTSAGRARLVRAAGELARGLRAAPADAYAWTRRAAVLVQLEGATRAAAQSLSTALMIAPRDRKLGAMQFDLAVVLWPLMDGEGREALARRARFIADEPALAPQAHAFAMTDVGRAVLGTPP
jgi:hypothetical protein